MMMDNVDRVDDGDDGHGVVDDRDGGDGRLDDDDGDDAWLAALPRDSGPNAWRRPDGLIFMMVMMMIMILIMLMINTR